MNLSRRHWFAASSRRGLVGSPSLARSSCWTTRLATRRKSCCQPSALSVRLSCDVSGFACIGISIGAKEEALCQATTQGQPGTRNYVESQLASSCQRLKRVTVMMMPPELRHVFRWLKDTNVRIYEPQLIHSPLQSSGTLRRCGCDARRTSGLSLGEVPTGVTVCRVETICSR